MKTGWPLRSVPVLISVAAFLLVVGAAWQTARLAQQNGELRATLSTARAESAAGPLSGQAGRSGNPSGPISAAAAQAEEAQAMDRASERVKKAAAQLGLQPDAEIKSFGRVETLAREGIDFMERVLAFSTAGKGPKDPEFDLNAFMNVMTDWMPKSELLGELEAQPARIARFHAAALQEALALDGPAVARLQPAIQAEFEKLAQRKLIRPDRPETEQAEWYKNRAAALAEAAARIEPLLPAGNRKPFIVEQVLHLGTGAQSDTKLDPDGSGHGTISMGFYFPGTGKK